jgi:hypothetical protein
MYHNFISCHGISILFLNMFVETKLDAHIFWILLMNGHLQYKRLLYLFGSSPWKLVSRVCFCRYALCRNVDIFGWLVFRLLAVFVLLMTCYRMYNLLGSVASAAGTAVCILPHVRRPHSIADCLMNEIDWYKNRLFLLPYKQHILCV